MLAAKRDSYRYIEEDIKWKETLKTSNANAYFPFLLHAYCVSPFLTSGRTEYKPSPQTSFSIILCLSVAEET
jgi:hypothetical protein